MGDMGGYTEMSTRQLRSQGPPTYAEQLNNDQSASERVLSAKPGRLPARWISDFISSADELADHQVLQCQISGSSTIGPHDICIIPNQTEISTGTASIFSSFCKKCHRHYILRTFMPESTCDISKHDRMHHLIQVPIEAHEFSERTKYHPLIVQIAYRCSSHSCSFRVVVDVCDPRLGPAYEVPLLDINKVRLRLADLSAADPARFAEYGEPDRQNKLYPAGYLLQYLNNVVEPKTKDVVQQGAPTRSKVALRNKIFELCFLTDLLVMFEYLEFERIGEENDQQLLVPVLQPRSQGLVPYDSRRAFFEDVRFQVEAMCDKAGLTHATHLHLMLRPINETEPALVSMLQAKYIRTRCDVDVLATYEARDFTLLGVERNMQEVLLAFACRCQGQTCPDLRQLAFEALKRVASGRESTNEELRQYLETEEVELVTLQSLQPEDTDPLSIAYRHFSIDPNSIVDNDLVLQSYHKLTESSSSSEAANHRRNLYTIGASGKSESILHVACTFTPKEALQYLCVGEDTDLSSLAQTATVNPDYQTNTTLTAHALLSLARANGDHPELIVAASSMDPGISTGQNHIATMGSGIIALDGPVGLENIRNTCYLNSILQYLNTVKPVRNVVLDWEQYKLEAPAETRRIAGSGSELTIGDAFLSREFMKEMRHLFNELQTSTVKVFPSQRLANAALKTAEQLLKDAANAQALHAGNNIAGKAPGNEGLPPPLPVRPTTSDNTSTLVQQTAPDDDDSHSVASSGTLVQHTDDGLDQEPTLITMSNKDDVEKDKDIPCVTQVKTREVLEHSDEEGENAGGDTVMTGVDAPPRDAVGTTVRRSDPRKDEEQIAAAINDESIKGTDQQDVDEAMGSILEHLQGAIKPTGINSGTNAQTDNITETFYWQSVNLFRQVDKVGRSKTGYTRVAEMSRWITAFPPPTGRLNLYEALDNNFDQQFEDGREQFSSITQAPPILHVYIQRASQDGDGKFSRNDNVVEIPERLYLDRYMDSDVDSDLFKRRQRGWNLKRRIQTLDASGKYAVPILPMVSTSAEPIEADYDLLEEFDQAEYEAAETAPEFEPFSVLDADIYEYLADAQIVTDDPPASDGRISAPPPAVDPSLISQRMRATDEEVKSHRAELAGLFTDLTQHGYRLHAIICHLGPRLGSGHYWVWIYDFEGKVWRKYNDETVEEYQDITNVLDNSKEPYYLAYVREDRVDELVQVPRRLVPVTDSGAMEVDEGVVMDGQMSDGSAENFNGDGDVLAQDFAMSDDRMRSMN